MKGEITHNFHIFLQNESSLLKIITIHTPLLKDSEVVSMEVVSRFVCSLRADFTIAEKNLFAVLATERQSRDCVRMRENS